MEPSDERVADSNETNGLEDQNPNENDGNETGQDTWPPRADKMTVGSDALSLPRSDEEKMYEGDLTIKRMTYFVPCQMDLLKTSWNPDANPEKWIKKIFAIVKNADKSAALLAQYNHEGKWKRYKEISDIPSGSEMGFRIKRKQHRSKIQTLFAEFEMVTTPKEIKQLDGIKNINAITPVYRADRYSGEQTWSVGWLMGIHPSLTHAETLTRKIEDKFQNIKITEGMARGFQKHLPQYDHQKNILWSEIKVPPFHLTTEERNAEDKEKNVKVRVLAIHTSKSAAP